MADGGKSAKAVEPAVPLISAKLHRYAVVLSRYLLAMLIGTAGSLTFVYLHLPLPWFLGALTFCLVASVLQMPILRPMPLSIPMRAVLGLAVGSAFTPLLFARFGSMISSIAILVPFMGLIIVVSLAFYERLAGFDRPTAFFSAVPGGLTDMTTMAEDAGANTRSVILVQATRILMIVFTLPLWLRWHDGLAVGWAVAGRARLADVSVLDLATLVAAGWSGWWIARRVGMAGAPIVGPMIVSGLLHASGVITTKVSLEVLTFAQITVGVLLGCQFRGLTMREFTGTVIWGIANTIVLLIITGVIVIGVSHLTGFDPVSVLLAFAPGGQTELNLLAFILGLDVGYVALHHLVRVAIVILGAQIVFRTRKDWRKA